MQIIKNNPYRVLGLLSGATIREKERQIKRLRQFIDAEQDLDDDFSFPILGALQRTLENVNDAASRLDLNNDKVQAALFWFFNGNHTDEPVLDGLKESLTKTKEHISIWTKLVSGEVSKRSYSAFQNLSVLYLYEAFLRSTINTNFLVKGISLKLKLIESEFFNDFIRSVTDETYKISKEQIEIYFLTQIESEINTNKGITTNEFIGIINNQYFSAKEEFLKVFIQKPIQEVEKRIEEARIKRKTNKANAINIGKSLIDQTSENLLQIRSILGNSNIKYSSISDRLADELIECGIDYFVYYNESSIDPSNLSMNLFQKAKVLAIGNIAKQKCRENIDSLQQWIDEKPKRDKLKLIENDIKLLLGIFESFEKGSKTIGNATLLLNQCKPYLVKIKSTLGKSDDLYLKLSTKVAIIAQQNVIQEVNQAQENFERRIAFDRYGTIAMLSIILKNAWAMSESIGKIDMEYEFRTNHYNPNKNTLQGLCRNLGVDTSPLETQLKRELSIAHSEMEKIREWQFLRSESDRQNQINTQQRKIDEINRKINNLK